MNAVADPAPEPAPDPSVTVAAATDKGVDITVAVNTIRVAVKPLVGGEVPIIVDRLKTGEPLPAGTIEAVLVLTGEGGIDKEIDIGKRARSSFDYRAFETWARRCRGVIKVFGERALRYWQLRLRARGRM
jgi:hypothetical protein